MVSVFGIYIFRLLVFLTRVNYVDMCVTFLFNCVLELVVSPEEGSSLLPILSVLCSVIIVTVGKVLVSAIDITDALKQVSHKRSQNKWRHSLANWEKESTPVHLLCL
jgi:hypothetical protein